jgi:hypothetical protein
MDPVNLAYPVEQRSGSGDLIGGLAWLWHLVVNHPVVSAIVVGAWVIYSVIVLRWMKRHPWEPTVERATLSGTAQVLSLKTTSRRDVTGRRLCRIKVAVHVPGREPYVTEVKKMLGPEGQFAAQPGTTVGVRADPDRPEMVRIDLIQRMPPPGGWVTWPGPTT